ncbi:hypothetical protein N7490_012235 [Penicillium lividum]|nr:hypothetical protein N7490_012235 [Penicillium lividum]
MTGGFLWKGCIGPGLVILEDIVRTTNHPQNSQVTQAVYAKRFDIQGLKHIFVADIINPKTVAFVGPNLYGEDADPWITPGVQAWEHNTDEYQGLLGTPLGKVAASVVLGAISRGTRRIPRVATWIGNNLVYMRVDIDVC